jgi:hypothetical protein
LALGVAGDWINGVIENLGGQLSTAGMESESELVWAGSQRKFDCVLAAAARKCSLDDLPDFFRGLVKPRASLFLWFVERCFLAPRVCVPVGSNLMAVRGKRLAGVFSHKFRPLRSTPLGLACDELSAPSMVQMILPPAVMVMEFTGRG